MTNDKAQMTNKTQNSNDKMKGANKKILDIKAFELHLTFGFWHLAFNESIRLKFLVQLNPKATLTC